MKKRTRRKYTQEFKEEAVKLTTKDAILIWEILAQKDMKNCGKWKKLLNGTPLVRFQKDFRSMWTIRRCAIIQLEIEIDF